MQKKPYLDFVAEYTKNGRIFTRHEGHEKAKHQDTALFHLLQTPGPVPKEFLAILPSAVNGVYFHKMGDSHAAIEVVENGRALARDAVQDLLEANYYATLKCNHAAVHAMCDDVRTNPAPGYHAAPVGEWVRSILFAGSGLKPGGKAHAREAGWVKDNPWIWSDRDIVRADGGMHQAGIQALQLFNRGFSQKGDALHVLHYQENNALLCHRHVEDAPPATMLVTFTPDQAIHSAYAVMEGIGRKTVHCGTEDYACVTAQVQGGEEYTHEGLAKFAALVQPAIDIFRKKRLRPAI